MIQKPWSNKSAPIALYFVEVKTNIDLILPQTQEDLMRVTALI